MQDNLLTKVKKFFNMNEEKVLNKEPLSPVADSSAQSNKNEEPEFDPGKFEAQIEDNVLPKVENSQNEQSSDHSPEEVKEEVIKVLKSCYDPEIPVDIWELGLIYDIAVATNRDVLINMTLTSPSCPVAGTLPNEVEQKSQGSSDGERL